MNLQKINTDKKNTSNNKLDYREQANHACDIAFTEIFPKLEREVELKLPKDFVECLEKLDLDNFVKLKSWMYVRVKQILYHECNVPKDQLFGKNNVFSETDRRLKIYSLINSNFYELPQFKKQEEEWISVPCPKTIKNKMTELSKNILPNINEVVERQLIEERPIILRKNKYGYNMD